MKIKPFYMLLLLVYSLASCQEEQEFKIPVDAGFFMDINRNTVANSRLQFDDGYIVIASFGFEGEREQAEEVEFSREYSQGLAIPFTSDKPVEGLHFQIPQGNYTSISVEFDTFDGFDEDNLLVKGSYKNSEGSRYPLVFILHSSESFEIEAESYSDGSQIIIKKEAPVSAYIKLNPVYWFEEVSLSALDEAEVVLWNGVPTIVISEEINEEIYDLVEERLQEGAKVIFVY
jgi:hypothetical protein